MTQVKFLKKKKISFKTLLPTLSYIHKTSYLIPNKFGITFSLVFNKKNTYDFLKHRCQK